MKLGMINGYEEECFAENKKLGLDAIEFCINYNQDSAAVLARADEIKGYSEKYGIAVTAIGRWGMIRVDEKGAIPEALQHDRNLIDLCEKLGCPVYNVGCNKVEQICFNDNCKLAIEYFAQLIEYGKAKGVKIAVYNCDWENFVYDDKAWDIVLGALPELGIKYDSSHSINRGGDYRDEIRRWAERFYHFHAKGLLHFNHDSYDDPPAGLDSISWPEVMSLLYINNYNATVSIEPHSGRWQGKKRQWGTQFTVNFLRPYIMPDDYEF